MFRKAILSLLAVMLVGCAAQPRIKSSEALDPVSTTFLLPAPETTGGTAPATPKDLAEKIQFKNHRYLHEKNVEALRWKILPNSFAVENYKAFLRAHDGMEVTMASVIYEGTLQMTKSDGNYQLVFTLNNKTFDGYNDIRTYNVTFNPSDVTALLKNAEMPLKFEVDSEFNTDATYANFARLARKEVFRGGGQKDPVTGKIFKERFWVRVSGQEIPVNVETYPYRHGSKAVVYAVLPGKILKGKTSDTVDFVNSVDAFKKEIERIIKS